MTAPIEPKFNAELAWDITEWRESLPTDANMSERESAKALATFLTEKGYTKGKSSGLLGALSGLEDLGTKLADELGPIVDSFRKPRI